MTKSESEKSGGTGPGKSDHPDPGGNWPSKTGEESGGGRGNAPAKSG